MASLSRTQTAAHHIEAITAGANANTYVSALVDGWTLAYTQMCCVAVHFLRCYLRLLSRCSTSYLAFCFVMLCHTMVRSLLTCSTLLTRKCAFGLRCRRSTVMQQCSGHRYRAARCDRGYVKAANMRQEGRKDTPSSDVTCFVIWTLCFAPKYQEVGTADH